jgi:hypothetical protein
MTPFTTNEIGCQNELSQQQDTNNSAKIREKRQVLTAQKPQNKLVDN